MFWLTWLLIGINIVINISLAFSFGFQCIPRRKIWTPTLAGRCIDLGAAFLVSAITNTVTDIAAFLLPLYSIWDLQLPWERKVGVLAVFGVGLLYVIQPQLPRTNLSPLGQIRNELTNHFCCR